MKTIKTYLCHRLNERSFWVGVGTAVSGVAVLPVSIWWKIAVLFAGVMASLMPDGKIRKDKA